MKLPFRQGIVDAQKNGLGQPQFILPSSTPGYLQLSATTTATTINVAHGSSDYLFTFNQNVDPAWGPLTPGVNNYLYWNVDIQTAAVTYGITTLEPIISSTVPASPQVDQHWLDLETTTMKVWSGAKWQVKIRLFAGMIPNGNLSSDQTTWCYPLYQPWALASQLMVDSNPGYVMTDIFGKPVYLSAATLEFMTSKTEVRYNSTVGTSGILSQPTNAVFPVKAGENIPPMSVVYISGENQVGLASGNPAVAPPKTPIGIVQNGLSPGEMGILHQAGEISSDSWDWSEHIGKPLYCGDYGQIVTYRPAGLLAYRIGFVKNRNTIVFGIDAETMPQVYQAGSSDIVVSGEAPLVSSFTTNGLGERVWTLSIPESSTTADGYMSSGQSTLLNQHQTRLDQVDSELANRSVIGHTHAITDVVGLQSALDGKTSIGHTHLSSDITDLDVLLAQKINIVAGAEAGNFPALTADGDVVDSGVGLSDLLTLFASINHTHSQFASASHTHLISDVTGLQLALDGKAPTLHGHVIGDVTGLQLALDGKAPTLHGHSISDVTGLQASLDGKAPTSHTHTPSDITGGVSGQVLVSNGTTGTWTTLDTGGGSVSVPNRRIPFGNTSGVLTSSARLQWNDSSKELLLGDGTGDSAIYLPTVNATNIAGSLRLFGASNDSTVLSSSGGGVVILGGTGAIGGTVFIAGGYSRGTGIPGGAVDISSGAGGNGSGSTGTVTIRTGDGGADGNSGNITIRPGFSRSTGVSGSVTVSGGDVVSNFSTTGGNVTVRGGNSGQSAETGSGGNVFVDGGRGNGGGGYISLRTSPAGSPVTERLRIANNGAFLINNTAGTAGQVLTSNGSSSSPTWQTISAGATNINQLTDVDTATTAPTVGSVLMWDGANWVPASTPSPEPSLITQVVQLS